MPNEVKLRVAINGYGVIGNRVADAVALQPDMQIVGVADVAADWRIAVAMQRGFAIFAASDAAESAMRAAGLPVSGNLAEMLASADVVVDATPKAVATANIAAYRSAGLKFIVQGGEKHAATGHSFVAEASYLTALNRQSTRVVSCNTTSIVRTLTALKQAGLLLKARGVLLRRATDPWESHQGGIMNTLVPEPTIPSHQGPDAQSVDPDLDLVTMAVKVPETLSHLHYWSVTLTRPADREDVLRAFRASSRILLLRGDAGLGALNAVKEWMQDIGRPRGDLYEVAVWEGMLTVQGDELFYAYMVDNQAIVVPETIDAIRAICGLQADPATSIRMTDAALGIGGLQPRGGPV